VEIGGVKIRDALMGFEVENVQAAGLKLDREERLRFEDFGR